MPTFFSFYPQTHYLFRITDWLTDWCVIVWLKKSGRDTKASKQAGFLGKFLLLRTEFKLVGAPNMHMLNGLVPRHQFISSLALHHKLTSFEKLIKMGHPRAHRLCSLWNTSDGDSSSSLLWLCLFSQGLENSAAVAGTWQAHWELEYWGWMAIQEGYKYEAQKCYIGVPVCNSCLCHMDREEKQKIELKEAGCIKPSSGIVFW